MKNTISYLKSNSTSVVSTSKLTVPFLEITNITKIYDGKIVIDSISLKLEKGEIFILLGSSGCGKSTLLRILAGFETQTHGIILLDGQDISGIPPYYRPVNMMFQSYALFPHMTVEKNIAFGLKQSKLSRTEIKQRVDEMLSIVRLKEYATCKPYQMSGGQQQRIALARSLIKQPKLLLLDEPMGALDRKLRGCMQLEIIDILKRIGVTCLIVTHDQQEAMIMADRIAIMNNGKFIQIGEPKEIYEHPNSRFSAEFIGSVNIFKGALKKCSHNTLILHSPGLTSPLLVNTDVPVTDDLPIYVALRPEKIMLCDDIFTHDYNFTIGKVINIFYLGDASIYYICLNSGQIITAKLTNTKRYNNSLPTCGSQVNLCWEVDSCVVLTT